MNAWDTATHRADVVILTAIWLEFAAVLAVDAGAVPGSEWDIVAGPNGLPVAFRSFAVESGRALHVAVAVSADMGATAAVHALLPLVEAFKPRWVAMCGVCAGRRGKTRLGDVVAADRLFFHDTGKQLPGRIQQDLITYKLRDDWKVALEGFDAVAQFRDAAWFQRRPLTTEWREHRALIALRNGAPEPWNAVEPELGAASWKRIVDALRERKLLAASGRKLTDEGHRKAADLLFEHQDELPDLSPTGTFQPFQLHVAPIGSGTRVIENEEIWGFVSQAMRKTLGVDMEAAVLGELAHRQRQHRLDVVVMKGVMDFADHGRDDHFKEFAARASAECLLWFLRQRVSAERTADGDNVVTSNTSSLSTANTARPPRPPGDRLDYAFDRQRHTGFLGRETVLAELDQRLVQDDTDRWVVVTGGPGMGKSAILAAWLARREAAGAIVPHHFIRRGESGSDEPAKIMGSLAAQIETYYPAQRDPDARPESRLMDLLTRVSARELTPRGGHLVLLIDGLDEYDAPADAYNPLAAFLPQALPHVRLLCASRPRHPYLEALETRGGELTRLDLDDPSAVTDNDATVHAFWLREAAALGLDDRFIEEAAASARGNMQHAVTLQRHLASVPLAERRVEAIPRGLKALLTLLWRRIANHSVATRGLGILCAAREPLSLDELGEVAGWDDVAQRAAFKQTALEFLIETRREGGVVEYRLHHESIRAHIVEQIGPAVVRDHHAALTRKLATWPTPADAVARRYALRHALTHRAEAGDWAAVSQLAGNLGFLEAKCRDLGVHSVEADVARAAERCRTNENETIGRGLGDLARALARESHWLRDEPGALPAQLWNRLRRMGWSTNDLDKWLQTPKETPTFVRVRHAAARESSALVRDLVGHVDLVTACVVTPDGKRVVSASADKTIKLWDLDTGRVLATFKGHTEVVSACTITADGRRVVSASGDQTVKIWDLYTGRVLTTLEGHTEGVTGCAVTPDGKRVVSTSADRTVKLWDLDTGHVLNTLHGHTNWVMSCAVTPDGRRVVSTSWDKEVKVWDLDIGRVVTTFEGHTGPVMSCAVTPDGRCVISAASDGIKVWDLNTGHVVITFEDQTGAVLRCAVTPDGRHVVSASSDGTLNIWSLATGRVVTTLEGHITMVTSCAITSDGRRIVSSSDGTLKVWDFDTRRIPMVPEGHDMRVMNCAVTPDGRRLVSASLDSTLNVWDVDTGRAVVKLEGHTRPVTSGAILPDGRRVISTSWDETIKVWDLGAGRAVMTLEGHTGKVTSCAIMYDCGRIVSASGDKTLKIWDFNTGRIIATLEGHTAEVNSCAVTPDRRRAVSASGDKTLKVWNLDTCRLVTTLEGHTDEVNSCAVTPDGKRVVSASSDKTLKVWDLDTGQALTTIEGHSTTVNSCAVTPDGERVISASWDRTIKVWDLATYKCLATLRGDTGFTALTATETSIYAGDVAGSLWFLDWPQPQSARS